MNTTLSPAATYVDAVRTALGDLPADDLAEIVEDVRDHVEQVLAELGADATTAALEARLGTPAVYAAELRSAAGYPPGPGDVGPAVRPPRVRRQVATWIVRIAVVLTLIALLEAFVTGRYGGALALAIVAWLAAALVGLVWLMAERSTGTMGARLGELPDARRMNGLIRWLRGNSVGAALVETIIALRPAWWIARAWIAVELVGMFFSAQWFPLPTFTGAPLGFALAVVISVWLGRRAAGGRRQANMSSCSSGTSWPCWGWQLSSEHWQAAACLVTTTSSTVRMPPSLELSRLVRSMRTARRSPTCIHTAPTAACSRTSACTTRTAARSRA